MPSEWEPLKITGTPDKGNMIVGDNSCAIFSINWEKSNGMVAGGAVDWLARRWKKLGVIPHDDPPASENFTDCGWAHGVQTEEGKETTYWFGFNLSAALLLGVKINGVLPEKVREQAVRQVLPSLRATPVGEDTIWSLYDVSFVVPGHYTLKQRHLYSGDVALEFTREGAKDSLLVRQVYPGDLALTRRPFERWIDMRPFKEHRRLRKRSVQTQAWQNEDRKGLSGIVRKGRKRLGVPLGWCSPRSSCAVAAHDQDLNRLLVVEHLSSHDADRSMCEAVVSKMNHVV
jgi:hypothetical protein